MKGSSGAGWATAFFAYLTFSAWLDDEAGVANIFGVVALGFLAVYFICRSIESLKEDS